MNILIVDFFNLIKRYTFLIDDNAPSIDTGTFYDDITTKIINIVKIIVLNFEEPN